VQALLWFKKLILNTSHEYRFHPRLCQGLQEPFWALPVCQGSFPFRPSGGASGCLPGVQGPPQTPQTHGRALWRLSGHLLCVWGPPRAHENLKKSSADASRELGLHPKVTEGLSNCYRRSLVVNFLLLPCSMLREMVLSLVFHSICLS